MGNDLLLETPCRLAVSPRSMLIGSTQPMQEITSIVVEERVRTRRFEELAAKWKSDIAFISSISDMESLSSFRGLVAMGWNAVPLLLRALESDPNYWFLVLQAITGENPVSVAERGNFDAVAKAWAKWGQDQSRLLKLLL